MSRTTKLALWPQQSCICAYFQLTLSGTATSFSRFTWIISPFLTEADLSQWEAALGMRGCVHYMDTILSSIPCAALYTNEHVAAVVTWLQSPHPIHNHLGTSSFTGHGISYHSEIVRLSAILCSRLHQPRALISPHWSPPPMASGPMPCSAQPPVTEPSDTSGNLAHLQTHYLLMSMLATSSITAWPSCATILYMLTSSGLWGAPIPTKAGTTMRFGTSLILQPTYHQLQAGWQLTSTKLSES